LLRDLVDLRPGEARAVLPALALAFLGLGMNGLAQIAADTIFVSAFDLGQLSRFFVVSSVVRVVVTFGFGALARRLRVGRRTGTFDAAAVGTAAATMLATGLLARSSTPTVLYAVCIAQIVFPSLVPLVAMNAAMDCFHARQAKRLLPLVAAAATVGTIAVGAVAKVVAPRLGTPALLLLGAACGAFALPLPRMISASARRAEAAPSPRGSKPAPGWAESFRDLRTTPAVRVLVSVMLAFTILQSFVDFGFKAQLKAAYARDDMAAYIGTFHVVLNAAILVAQLFFSGRAVARFGVRATLQAAPGAVLAVAPALALAPGVASASAGKLVEGFMRYAVVGAVSPLLLTPTPPEVRTRANVFVKGAAAPMGVLVAGLVLSAFGEAGPSPAAVAALVAGAATLGVIAAAGARRAYLDALARALGEGRLSFDVPPQSASALRASCSGVLADAVARGEETRARQLLALMSDKLFTVDDLASALRAGSRDLRSAAVEAVARARRFGASRGDVATATRLLDLVPASDDDELERQVLAVTRELGGSPPLERVKRALARAAERGQHELWGEAQLARARVEREDALTDLRVAAGGSDVRAQAAALEALGLLADEGARDLVLTGLSSADEGVFASAGRAAMRLRESEASSTLVRHLVVGPHFKAAASALALGGSEAVDELMKALPKSTAGEAASEEGPRSARPLLGTIRAARVLARLGPASCVRMLERFPTLGHQARCAIARALATAPPETRAALPPEGMSRALDAVLSYAEALVVGFPAPPSPMLRREVQLRIADAGERALDLASVTLGRDLVARVRAALARHERERGNALEVLENALPGALAARFVKVLDFTPDAVAKALSSARPDGALPLDAWLEKCRRYDSGELASGDVMQDVIAKLLVLGESSLFAGLSGEELYPVGQIAETVALAPGQAAVKQGDPGDALFVVAKGTLRVTRDGTALKQVSRGAVFGEVALLDGAPRSATVEAVSDSEVLRIPRAEFEALLDERPELARGIIRTLLGHLRQ
jgi:hypothetical protein